MRLGRRDGHHMAATETLLALREKIMTESVGFQVSLSGLDVGLQTWDDALKSDGWADEVSLQQE